MLRRNIIRGVRGVKSGTRNYSVRFPQTTEELNHEKPTLSDFKNPLLHTFLIASSAYMALHIFVLSHEYEVEEQKLADKERSLEVEIEELLKQKKQKKWFSLWR